MESSVVAVTAAATTAIFAASYLRSKEDMPPSRFFRDSHTAVVRVAIRRIRVRITDDNHGEDNNKCGILVYTVADG